MDDDSKKSGGPKGRKSGASAGARDGRPRSAAAGKPGAKRFDKPRSGKPTGGKPFAKTGPRDDFKRADDSRPFRAKREDGDRPRFSRDAKPGDERKPAAAGAYRKGPRKEWQADGDAKPFRPKRDFSKTGDGESRPFRAKREDGERPRFSRDAKPGDERKPAAAGKGPRKEWQADGDAKSFRPKRDFAKSDDKRREFAPRRLSDDAAGGASRTVREPARPEWKKDRETAESRGDPRPGRAAREHGKSEGFKPRSFGMKQQAGPRNDGERPRSYGMKSHGGSDRPGGERGRFRKPEVEAEAGERIAKRLARAGIASRREAEDLVASGRVRVNGQVLSSPAFNVSVDDRIELDGTEIPPIERTRLFLFHKPGGLVTTNHDPEGRKTVFDALPEGLPRLMTVGRLDINTEGLLLLTNDGGLSRVLELPATGWLRRYRVRVHGDVDEKALAGLKDGIAVGGVFYGAIEAALERTQGTNAWLTIGLREGKNREVKNVLGALGLEVTRLIRISFGPFQLGDLPEGQVQELKGKMLRDQLGDRLIEEAGANFEAPITRPFSNKAEQVRPREEAAERPRREQRLGQEGEGGLIKNRKRWREDRRDDALGRLSTRPERDRGFGERPKKPGFAAKGAGKPVRGKDGERETRAIEPPGQRKANVWMAPGARPQGKKKDEDAKPARPPRGNDAGSFAGRAGKPGVAGRGDRPAGPRGDRPRGPRKG